MKTFRSSLLCAAPFVLAFAQGCAPESMLDQQTEEVVGGTATTARPEVGQFFRAPATAGGNWSSCTATLVGSRYVITAAHCLNTANYQDTAVRAGDQFSGTYTDGTNYSFAVERIQSFGNFRWEFTPGGTMTTDIAVLRLSQRPPLPGIGILSTRGMRPAGLAAALPATGSLVTLYGYGCTNRIPQSGGGMKQRLNFTYGSATTALCWGDSGGPVFAGSNVWGINSDFASGNVTATTTDVFADVPHHRGRIESTFSLWESNDFDESGTPDILWQNNDTRQLSVWFMQDSNVQRDQVFAGPETGFRAVAVGDFNRDDRRDIVFYNKDTGVVRIWTMNGTTRLQELTATWQAAESTGWRFVTAGDFDQDGVSDLVWFYPANGTVAVWFMDGATVRFDRSMSWTAGGGSGWTPKLAADFDRDGHTDLFWVGPNGALGIWYMNGTTVRTDGRISRSLATFDTRSPFATGDFDRDGRVDLAFRDSVSGAITVWYLDGVTYRHERSLDWTTPAWSPWQVARPQ